MGINLGSTAIADMKLGSAQVEKAYLGTTQVWPTGGSEDPTTWTGIQQIVQNGNASNYFAVGDEIDVACPWIDPSSGTQYNWVWVVADIGNTYKESDPSTAVPSMTLIAKYLTPSEYIFDAAENTTATEETALDGVYYYGWNGSMVALNLATGATIPYGNYTAVYKSSVNTSGSYMRDMAYYGYNNWELSNIRQWLNSDGSAGAWFTPSHVGDKAPNYSSQAGFLSGFSSEFRSVLTPTRSGASGNTETDGGTNYYTYDRMFLPSRYEVKLDTSLSYEGPVFALYTNAQNADRVKYLINSQSSASPWALRSSYRSTVDGVYSVSSSGSGSSSLSDPTNCIAPACRIC